MSIISAVLTKHAFTIVTDTLEALPNTRNVPPSRDELTGLKSKIFHYPHLKCSTVLLGLSKVAAMHTEFISQNFIQDASDLYEQTLNKFIPSLDMDLFRPEPLNPTICSIYIFGYSNSEGGLVACHLGVIKGEGVTHNKKYDFDPESNKSGLVDIMSPPLSSEDYTEVMDSFDCDYSKVIFSEYALLCAKKAHANYLNHENENRCKIPVGGELHLTFIGILDGKYTTNTITAHRFPDYDETVIRIKRYLAREEAISNVRHQLECLDEFVNASMPAIHVEVQDQPV
jgi:hypothetical protein